MELSLDRMFEDVRKIVEQHKDEAEKITKEAADLALQNVAKRAPQRKKQYTGKRANRVPGSFAKGFKLLKRYRAGVNTYTITNDPEYNMVHFLVDGTDDRETKNGANRGKLKADAFLVEAFDETVAVIEAKYKI